MGDLNPPQTDIDPEQQTLWLWFWNLREACPHGMNGPQPIQYTQIESWMRVTGEFVLREEVQILKEMDTAFLAAHFSEKEEHQKRQEAEQNG